jgi:hypothetical protein
VEVPAGGANNNDILSHENRFKIYPTKLIKFLQMECILL